MTAYPFDAVIFDLDGVITKTALVHSAAWKNMFDEFLMKRSRKKKNEAFREFTHERDYLQSVDGNPKYDGVKSFLESRGIKLAFGVTADSPEAETICGLGNKKNQVFNGKRIRAWRLTTSKPARSIRLSTSLGPNQFCSSVSAPFPSRFTIPRGMRQRLL